MAARVARVMIDSPVPALDHLFDYAIPPVFADDIRVGCRVRVPLRSGGRLADGYVVELADSTTFDGELSELDDLISSVPILAPEVWRVARTVADRAAGSASDIVRLAVPKRHVRVEKAWLEAEPSMGAVEPAPLEGYPASADLLSGGTRTAMSAIPQLSTTEDGATIGRWAQSAVELATQVLARGRKIIIAVPDYRDLGQVLSALAPRVPPALVSRLDAKQPAAQRYRAFLECLNAGPRVIVGNRSAVYAPASDLDAILLWDDGDDLHAEPLAPYVHTRDAALVRQQDSGCALILMSHARSVESERLVEIGWLRSVSPERHVQPRVVLTNPAVDGDAARIPSTAWKTARSALDAGPVLVQVARPGYAPVVACQRCRTGARCAACGGPLGIRKPGRPPECTLCGAIAAEWRCDECGDTHLRLVSRGSARTTEELGRAFPGTSVITSDGDHPVERVPAKPALVVATRGAEPIAEGGYRAVLLLDGDRMLAREALTIASDCLRWWSNAAALAATGAPVVLVGVAGRLGTAFATWTSHAFAAEELADRRELGFPPAVRTVSVSGDLAAVESAVASLDTTSYRDVLGPSELPDGGVRSIVRFDYSAGPEVARALRAAIIANATRRRRSPAAKGGYRPPPTLRIRFDETELVT
ncbi:primosomal protein N' [Paramicrobacterium agarici]|uniref:Probable replication restart protein PriA n=1 Tax=Paramicrobacterium agarici TaxID=630514 RepID=A0A2A9DXL2_9MICO|nr:primosomal protein N' [Microbacterium agarici]PFG31324.1 replication restart DNA helicase PriA [Microbacterium agarici]TQO21210.1 replication restart DNA helicase PriA [Microbacterium agarici]